MLVLVLVLVGIFCYRRTKYRKDQRVPVSMDELNGLQAGAPVGFAQSGDRPNAQPLHHQKRPLFLAHNSAEAPGGPLPVGTAGDYVFEASSRMESSTCSSDDDRDTDGQQPHATSN